jgi:hypothetical protein
MPPFRTCPELEAIFYQREKKNYFGKIRKSVWKRFPILLNGWNERSKFLSHPVMLRQVPDTLFTA